ncbi:MAG TPA: sigma-54 dependent transcriptional regulator [Thermoanaerobaculia bacterium]
MQAMEKRILVVDDDPEVRAGLVAILETEGWTVSSADSRKTALANFGSFDPDVVLLDVMLGDASGIDVLDLLKGYSEMTPIIMMSGVGTMAIVIDSMKKGAETFIQKPFDFEALHLALEQISKSIATRRELEALKRSAQPKGVGRLPGVSDSVRALNALVERIAPSQSPVLIEGESGTGKGVLARILHEQSTRARGPFVDLNCAGFSKELLESELFGHEKGSFTGAGSTKPGLFEIASAGTVFLDEIGELDISLQARLLKALEDKRFRRVGGVRDLQFDFRLIAATNHDLAQDVADGRFRKDLFYRLNVVRIEVPPLRDRLDDVPLLANHLIETLTTEMGRPIAKVSDRAMSRLSNYPWPGNIRELRNVLERALLVCHGKEIKVEDLFLDDSALVPAEADSEPLKEWEVRTLDDVTRDYIKKALEAVDGNVRKASRKLGISPSTLYARLKEEEATQKG